MCGVDGRHDSLQHINLHKLGNFAPCRKWLLVVASIAKMDARDSP
jgi:hypothetical protein